MSELDELEQGERVRNWLRQNGSTIVTGIALGVAAIFGWQWWQGSQAEHRLTAATHYEALVEAAERGERDTVSALAVTLADGYADTPYAILAALRLAETQAMAGENEQALATLETASGKSPDPALNELLQLRSARIEIALGRHEQALARLVRVGDAYAALAYELRGDAHLALGQASEALAAYEEALTRLDAAAPARPIVQMKHDDLAAACAAES
jgi:predicted negative regulator of RcsB-dependent stress response